MSFFVSIIILGCIYSLLAAGFVVIYKSSRVLNFSYTSLVVMLSYLTISVMKLIPGPPVLSIGVVLILSFFLGLLIYRFFIRPMAGQSVFSIIILTVSLGIVFDAVSVLVWRCETETVSLGWRAYYSVFGGAKVSGVEIIIVLTAVVFYACILLFYKYSKIGWQMRASAENVLLAAQRGINIYSITGLSWGIGIFATAIAAILLGASSSVSPQMGHIAIKAFAVALVGGLDSMAGCIPAAFIVALAELAANTYVNPRLADAIPFIIMLVVLVVRPWGLMGTEEEIERV